MGSSNSIQQIKINFHQQKSIYFTDEILCGFVNWTNQHEKIRVKEIYLLLIGEIGYTTTKTTSTGRGSETVTEYHHKQFYSSKISFALPRSGEDYLIFNQGHYSWPFGIHLLDCLPPSLNFPDLYPHIVYYLRIVIHKPWFQLNERQIRFLKIYPRVTFSNNCQYFHQATFKSQNRKDILLKGKINRINFIPGESIDFQIQIHNPKEILIKNIHLTIFQSFIIEKDSHQKSIFQTNIPTIENCKLKQIEKQFSITLPNIDIPPSIEFQPNNQINFYILNRYFIKLNVKVEGFFTNFDVNIPISIGTKSTINNNDDDLPPSYESVINNSSFQIYS